MEGIMPDGSYRNPFTTSEQTTLLRVLEQIESDECLPLQRRRNLSSSIRALAKLMGKTLDFLPAHPGFYRDILNDLHPEHCGLTESRIRNIKSDVLFALRHTGCIGVSHTYMAPFTPEWQSLWDEAECTGSLRRYVSRFMRFCSANGMQPDAVDGAVADQFLSALVAESFIKDPINTYKGNLRTWNKLVDAVSGWPSNRLIIAGRYRSVSEYRR